MERGNTFTHEGIEYTVINILEDGKIEGRFFTTPGPGSPPVQEIIIAEGDIIP